MTKQEEILDFIRLKGPVLPIHVSKASKLSLLFAGAYLSELSSSKKIIVSKLKVGSSPLYYTSGQEAKLQNYTNYLNPKEQSALEQLRENKVLSDNQLEPAIRVALREIPDFATPVKVNLKIGVELYWKWYLTPNNEAELLIREKIKSLTENQNQEFNEEQSEHVQQNTEYTKQEIEDKDSEKVKDEENIHQQEEIVKEQTEPITQESKESETEQPNKKEKESKETFQEEISKPKSVKNIKKKTSTKKKDFQKELIEKPKTKLEAEFPKDIDDSFFEKIKEIFNEKGISVTNCNIITKNKELDLTINIPTLIGELTYFCKAKKKIKSTEKDLFETLVNAQEKGLPGLYLSTGNINKQAKELIDSKKNFVQFMKI